MERRELVFMDAKSSKFWHIELDGSSHTVTYGRTGTDGQTKAKDFDSDEKAKASFEKLVSQKLAKGYVLGGDPSTDEDTDEIPAIAFISCTNRDDLSNNVKTFMGKRVADYNMEKGAAKGGKTIYRFRGDWDGDPIEEGLQHFLDSEQAMEATGIVIGVWDVEGQTNSQDTIKRIIAAKACLPELKGLYLGDITSEENEMSWIQQSDISPLLKAFPDLQLLRVRGGEGLKFSKPAHKQLRGLAIETGGLPAQVVRSICTSKFPNLEHLELWLGTSEYGGDSSVQDLQPILSGKLFPKLKYLGLRNCEFADDIAGVVVNSPIIDQIETLDLSLGVITDVGAQALLSLPQKGSLKKVSIHYNYASPPMLKKLKQLSVAVDVTGANGPDDEWRFVAVGE